MSNIPLVVNSNLVTCFDVDDTLIYWDYKKSTIKMGIPNDSEITISLNGLKIKKHKIIEHVEELKRQKESGACIVVWSASGYEWAQAVVEALCISNYVDLIMSKPLRIYDDKNPQDWMPIRRYMVNE